MGDAGVSAERFGSYADIVVVANNDRLDIAQIAGRFGPDTLFVFFNRPDAVLKAPFGRPSLLVLRSDATGALVIYKKALKAAVRWLEGPEFRGAINLRVHESEVFSPLADFEGVAVGFQDLTTYFEGFYPEDRWPSSGFAVAVWLLENVKARIHICGFTGRRSETQKVQLIHDWGFEQTVLRSLIRAGRLFEAAASGPERTAAERIGARFPEVSPEIALEAGLEVAGERIDGMNHMVDLLWSTTRGVRKIDGFFRALKPKKRKQKILEQAEKRRVSDKT
mgnify:CR=1 FL=1